MPRLTKALPKYRCHKASGQAVVHLSGRDVYLGPHGTQTSYREYDRHVSEWLADGRRPQRGQRLGGPTVADVIVRFWQHAERYYRAPDGNATGELDNYRQALGPLRDLYGHTAAADFGALALRTLRDRMVELGWSRTYLNRQVSRVRAVFKWAASVELVPATVIQSIHTVEGFRRGRCDARETARVSPVSREHVDAVLPHVSRQVRALIELQLLTGARAGELTVLRPKDITREGTTWTYAPEAHKTAHHGHARLISFGPRAQAILTTFLDGRSGDDFLFSPAEAESERRVEARKLRKTPLNCGNRIGTNRRINPGVGPGRCYTTDSYRRSIARACAAAGVPQWHPHQLRHTAATEFRRQYGIEAARVLLGHRSAAVTEIYAQQEALLGRRVMEEVG